MISIEAALAIMISFGSLVVAIIAIHKKSNPLTV